MLNFGSSFPKRMSNRFDPLLRALMMMLGVSPLRGFPVGRRGIGCQGIDHALLVCNLTQIHRQPMRDKGLKKQGDMSLIHFRLAQK